MNMQVLLEQSSIFTEVSKDQMDRMREKRSPVAVATQNRLTKMKSKQRARQSGRRASGRGKRTRVEESDDERDSEDVGEEPPKRTKVRKNDARPAFLRPPLVTWCHIEGFSTVTGGRRFDGRVVQERHFRDFRLVISLPSVIHRGEFY